MALVYNGHDKHERHLPQRALRRLMALLLAAQTMDWPTVVLTCVPVLIVFAFIAFMAWLDKR